MSLSNPYYRLPMGLKQFKTILLVEFQVLNCFALPVWGAPWVVCTSFANFGRFPSGTCQKMGTGDRRFWSKLCNHRIELLNACRSGATKNYHHSTWTCYLCRCQSRMFKLKPLLGHQNMYSRKCQASALQRVRMSVNNIVPKNHNMMGYAAQQKSLKTSQNKQSLVIAISTAYQSVWILLITDMASAINRTYWKHFATNTHPSNHLFTSVHHLWSRSGIDFSSKRVKTRHCPPWGRPVAWESRTPLGWSQRETGGFLEEFWSASDGIG